MDETGYICKRVHLEDGVDIQVRVADQQDGESSLLVVGLEKSSVEPEGQELHQTFHIFHLYDLRCPCRGVNKDGGFVEPPAHSSKARKKMTTC